MTVPVPHHIPNSRSGARIPVKGVLCDVTPMTTHTNQSIKLFKNILHWLNVAQSWEKEKNRKNCLDWIWAPVLETWSVMWNWNCHRMLNCSTCSTRSQAHTVEENRGSALWFPVGFTQCSNMCLLGSFLFSRQQVLARGTWFDRYATARTDSTDVEYRILIQEYSFEKVT